jgi:RF-1 domain
MITITDRIAIEEAEIAATFIRASGPGGQNVNKVSNAAQLRGQPLARRADGWPAKRGVVRSNASDVRPVLWAIRAS